MRDLTQVEAADLEELARTFDAVAPIEVTATQLHKSIVDATEVVRAALYEAGVHDYGRQEQGPEHKVLLEVVVVDAGDTVPSTMSLYRPRTKQGDPRLWPGAAWRDVAQPGEVWALCVASGSTIALVPVGRPATGQTRLAGLDADEPVGRPNPEPVRIARRLVPEATGMSDAAGRLLQRLRHVATQGPIVAQKRGDTAIGMAVERALGIEPNVSKRPDWEGEVEVKAHRQRRGRGNLQTIFAKTPDWSLTDYHDRGQVLDAFGQSSDKHDGRLRLYNTVSALGHNSHGLRLDVDHDADLLRAVHRDGRVAMVWRMSTLRKAVSAKHPETFWVEATSTGRNGGERFELVEVVHTARPRVWAMGALVEEGVITLDTTIGEKPDGSARDHGWLFRMFRDNLPRLFPEIGRHAL